MEDSGFGFEEFSTELEDFQMKKVRKFDRLWKVGDGGSIDQKLLLNGGLLYFGCCDHNVYAISAADGSLVWKFPTSAPIVESSPVIHDGTIYIGSYDQNLYALDAATGRLRWRFRTEGKIGASVSVAGGAVYFGSRDQNVYALDAGSGALLWKFRTMDEILSTPAVKDGRVYVGSFDQNLYCLEAGSGRLVWKFHTQGEIYNANPFLVHDGVIYFGSFDNYLRAVSLDGPKELWKAHLGTYATACSPVLYKGALYQETRDGSLIALTMEGEELWRFRTREAVALPHINKDRIYMGSADYNMYCLDMKGKVMWKFPTQGYVWAEAATSENVVYFSSWDCHIYAADRDTGREVWRFSTGSNPSYMPSIAEGFELVISRPADEGASEEKEKRYDLRGGEEHEGGAFYKTRITYQVSTRYREKGKYQSSDDED